MLFGNDIDFGRGGIEAVFDEFFDYGGGTLDDFSGGDAVDCLGGEGTDGCHGCFLFLWCV